MATREEIGGADRAILYLNNCQRDLRANAQSYLDEVAAGYPHFQQPQFKGDVRTPMQRQADIVTADGNAVSRLMVRLANFFSDPVRQANVANGLQVYGITVAQANQDRLMIKNAADAQAAADVSSDAAIIAAANATLAAVPAIDTLP
jgi:hypothetical protein